ncbi:MAG: pyruvate ferredoxin oxidoreductase [Firmicutes bacterium]|jgi:pyruvate ferredoxin oxidoreductase alpha subunit|nr:pyruvate ferredoxin oxidoreductase [Bacillota bacterium]
MAIAIATQKTAALTGNEAAAQALRQINPDVVAAYPITPQTEIVQLFSTFVSDGLVKTEFVAVESEHSAMSATVGAAAAGARAMTATSSQGLALMWEMLYVAAGMRIPIVMPMVNRALSSPINIHCDHSDSMGARDSGWLQIYSENAQEMYDNLIQAVRIAEHPDVLLPVMVTMDGFIISHGMENVELLPDQAVQDFVGEYNFPYPLLDVEHPRTLGPLTLQDFYFEHKREQAEAVYRAKEVILAAAEEYAAISGRRYGFFEAYRMDDAEYAVVVLGSTAGTAKYVVDGLRQAGEKCGLVKVRVFRPFPGPELCEALSGLKAVGIMDRADTFSTQGGPLFLEVKAALYHAAGQPQCMNFVYGLGGRDIDPELIRQAFVEVKDLMKKPADGVLPIVRYLGVRE